MLRKTFLCAVYVSHLIVLTYRVWRRRPVCSSCIWPSTLDSYSRHRRYCTQYYSSANAISSEQTVQKQQLTAINCTSPLTAVEYNNKQLVGYDGQLVTGAGIVWGSFPGGCPGGMSGRNVRIPMQDCKSLRVRHFHLLSKQ